jgi:hypothetical protein
MTCADGWDRETVGKGFRGGAIRVGLMKKAPEGLGTGWAGKGHNGLETGLFCRLTGKFDRPEDFDGRAACGLHNTDRHCFNALMEAVNATH